MKFILTVRNKIGNIYQKYPRISGYIGRLVFALICFMIVRSGCGYNVLFTNIWFVLVLSVFCAFAPTRFLVLIVLIYITVQASSLSLGVGAVLGTVLLIIYLIYFRFDAGQMYLVFLMPVFALAKVPLLLVLVLAVTAPMETLIAVVCGNLIYYMIRYINMNAAVISGMTGESEITKMTLVINGTFRNEEFLYTMVILVLIFLLVYYLKKLNVSQANYIAIAVGCGAYIILCIIANLAFGTVSVPRLVSIITGTVAAGLLALLAVYAVLPLDYTRIETFEFEDDEYHYYVRAVPKAVIKKESVRVKKINTRREVNSEKSREKQR